MNNSIVSLVFSSAILWIFTLVNVAGVKKAGKIQAFVTVFKIGFFALFIIIAFLNFDTNNILPMYPEGKGLSTVPLAATSTLWAFVGLESATVTAGELKNPEKNVRKSTIYGIIISAIIYLLISIGSMGAMSNSELAQSSAPLTDILTNALGNGVGKILTVAVVVCILGTIIGWLLSTARVGYAAGVDGVFPKFFVSNSELAQSSAPLTDILTNALGNGVGKILTVAVVVCILGTIIGWLLSTARVGYAAGVDGVFPKFFGKVSNKTGTPINSLIFSSALVNILLVMNFQKGMVDTFTFITILATLSYLPVYLLSVAAEMMLTFRGESEFNFKIFIKKSIVDTFTFITILATLSYLPVYLLSVAAEMMLTFRGESEFNFKIFIKKSILPLLAFIYVIWTIYGSGAEIVMWGFILMLAGIPVYIYNHHKNKLG